MDIANTAEVVIAIAEATGTVAEAMGMAEGTMAGTITAPVVDIIHTAAVTVTVLTGGFIAIAVVINASTSIG